MGLGEYQMSENTMKTQIKQTKQPLINFLRLSKGFYSRCLALLHRKAPKIDNGPSFCTVPWKHLYVCNSGTVKICCATKELHDDNGEPLNIHKHSMDQIWNSNHLRRVRRDMVMGKPVKECAHFCGKAEKTGDSRRMFENESWDSGHLNIDGVTIDNLKEEAKKNDYVVNHRPFDLVLEVSNLCNLACRMCAPRYSSKIEKDPVHNKWFNNKNPKLVGDLIIPIESPVFTTNEINKPVGVGIDHMEIKRLKETSQVHELVPIGSVTNKHWIEDNELVYKELLANPKKMKRILFIGGEPFIIKGIPSIIDYLIENGNPKDLVVSFSTNATIYNQKILDKAQDFKRMSVQVSMDGFGDVYEYIRYPAKWLNVKDKLLRISKKENIFTQVSITYQAYNALDLVELLHFVDQHDLHFVINSLNAPDYLSVAVLPPKARQVAAQRLREYVEKDCRVHYKRRIKSFIFQLEAMGNEWDIGLVRKFMLFTNDMDNSRNQSFLRTHKELLRYIEETGFIWSKETLHFEKATLPPITMQKSIDQTEMNIN